MDYITPEQVCELVPGLTPGLLAQMRYTGKSGLKFYKPTERKVLYKRSEVIEWVENSMRTSTKKS